MKQSMTDWRVSSVASSGEDGETSAGGHPVSGPAQPAPLLATAPLLCHRDLSSVLSEIQTPHHNNNIPQHCQHKHISASHKWRWSAESSESLAAVIVVTLLPSNEEQQVDVECYVSLSEKLIKPVTDYLGLSRSLEPRREHYLEHKTRTSAADLVSSNWIMTTADTNCWDKEELKQFLWISRIIIVVKYLV